MHITSSNAPEQALINNFPHLRPYPYRGSLLCLVQHSASDSAYSSLAAVAVLTVNPIWALICVFGTSSELVKLTIY
jgi:hypothetical protein